MCQMASSNPSKAHWSYIVDHDKETGLELSFERAGFVITVHPVLSTISTEKLSPERYTS